MRNATFALLMIVSALVLPACQSAYYSGMEMFGKHKRDIMVSRVEDARDEQAEAKEEFRSALDTFTEVVGSDGGDLRAKYDQLNGEFEDCEKRAEAVRERIDSVEDVSEDLFAEWEKELEQYSSADLRRKSEDQLRDTRRRYDQLIGAMRRAESRMDPVLNAFRDQVLFLKHNLNAQAIASLQGTALEIESDVADLIAQMEAAIAEADAFIESMGEPA